MPERLLKRAALSITLAVLLATGALMLTPLRVGAVATPSTGLRNAVLGYCNCPIIHDTCNCGEWQKP
jgi:hypothetical protein